MSPLGRLRRFLREATHAASGAPRLYRAARGAGAGPLEAVRLLVVSAVVLSGVAPRAAGVPGRQNAVRHFVWQAHLTTRHGLPVARAVAEAQEQGTVRTRDSAVDRHNNAVAQQYAAAHADELTGLGTWAALRTLLRAGLAAWDRGELDAGLRPARAGAGAGRRRRRSSRGRATPPSRP